MTTATSSSIARSARNNSRLPSDNRAPALGSLTPSRPLRTVIALWLGLAALLAGPGAAAAANDGLAMLRQLQPGLWTLRYREGAGPQNICVRSGLELLDLQSRRGDCRRTVVESDPGVLTVQYSCPGSGYTRTSIRRESGVLAQIHSQGLRDGSPFSFSAEARRVGTC